MIDTSEFYLLLCYVEILLSDMLSRKHMLYIAFRSITKLLFLIHGNILKPEIMSDCVLFALSKTIFSSTYKTRASESNARSTSL